MAKRFYGKEPTPPRAFMGHNEHQVFLAIKLLAREQRFMAVRHLTVEDFRQLFIPEHYRHSLKEAFGVASQESLDQTIEARVASPYTYADPNGQLTATFRWDYNECPEGFFALRGWKHELQPDVTPELMVKWNYVEQNLAHISYEWGLVNHVFLCLNQNGWCNTPQQMRFVWPAIRHLVAKAGLKELAGQLVESSARAGDRARVPAHIHEFLVPTVNIVNRTLLMGEVDLNEKREFRVQVNTPKYEAGGITFSGMN